MQGHDVTGDAGDWPDVEAWIDADPDPRTKAELRSLLRHGDKDELADRFSGTLEFGTAGLRGKLGGGPNRMNRAVVIKAARGLADFATTRIGPARTPARAVIGFDARHGSEQFAHDTAAVFTAAGMHAMLMPHPAPTPVLAFAVRHLEADVGVMVTASHNPAQDNGYKVYLGGRIVTNEGRGAQIVAPYDAEIAAKIAQVGRAVDVARAATGWNVLDQDLFDAYAEAALSGTNSTPEPKDLRIVHTAMHGVGSEMALRLLAEAGFADVHPVATQQQPDPDFPTVPFPNPEEKGAIDQAVQLARELDADLVIASDPDADRCAVAVPDPHLGGAWRMLHGDELGSLLGERIATQLVAGPVSAPPPVLANSVVSSRLLRKIALDHGLEHMVTLTGFKWISRAPRLAFGYEEAIGYCVDPAHVRDKDGLSAALVIAHYAAMLRTQGRSLIDALDYLARKHSLYLTDQLSLRVSDLAIIPALMARLRTAPPAVIAGEDVVSSRDLLNATAGLPATDALVFETATRRVIVRPSGTEPKLKCYLEVIEPAAPTATFEELTQVRGRARAALDGLKEEMGALLVP